MNELFEFPFRSDVWGTATDWAIVAVTAWTLFYLRKTLSSQQIANQQQSEAIKQQSEANDRQAEALEMDRQRYRRTILPIITVGTPTTKIIKNNDEYAAFPLNLERGHALEFRFGPFKNSILEIETFYMNAHWKPGEPTTIMFKWLNKGGLPKDSREGPLTVPIGKMYFRDELQNPYTQKMYTNGERIILGLAEEISEAEISSVIYNFLDFK